MDSSLSTVIKTLLRRRSFSSYFINQLTSIVQSDEELVLMF